MVRKIRSLGVAAAVLVAAGAAAQSAEPLRLDTPEAADPVAAASAGSARGIASLSWLAGCWQGEAGEECWLAPRDGLMIAVNRAPSRDGRPPFFELLRIVADEDGLVFLAQPRGVSPAVPFRAVELGERRVVFANPEHDFPQRLTYWREGERLRVRVEAQRDGEWGGFEQTYSPGSWSGE